MIAFAEPAAVVSAFFALLFMLGWYFFGKTITKALDVDLPIIGNVIGNLVADGLNFAYGYLVFLFDQAITPITEFFLRPIATIENTFDATYQTFASVYSAMNRLAFFNLPQAFTGQIQFAVDYSSAVLGAAELYTRNEVADIRTEVNSLADSFVDTTIAANRYTDNAIADLRNLIGNGVTDIDTVTNIANSAASAIAGQILTAAEGFTTQAFASATGYADTLAHTLENDITLGTQAAEDYANQLATTLPQIITTDIDNTISGALAGIYTDIDAAITDVTGIIGTGDADVLDGIKRIPVSIPLDLAGLVALTGAGTLTMLRYLKECGIPNCKNLSGLGNELQTLLGVVEDASFLALLISLIHDPGDAAATIDDAFGGAINSGVSLSKQLLGL